MGSKCDRGTIMARYQSLASLLGQEVALEMVEKEPVVLLWEAGFVAQTYRWLSDQSDQPNAAREVVRKNPKLLTIPVYEYERTKPSFDSLALSASGIDAVRPFGPLAPFLGITTIFISGLVVVRLVGNGLRPVTEAVTSSVTQVVPSLRPFDLLRMLMDNVGSSS